uniref:Retrotrans_gag domain-containing protein n=1 Tax=Strongyloides papillosus TaxID=174720 RepID=A0A0N5BHC9_STREA
MELRNGKMVPTNKNEDSSINENLKNPNENDDKQSQLPKVNLNDVVSGGNVNDDLSKSDRLTKEKKRTDIIDKLYNEFIQEEKEINKNDTSLCYSGVMFMHQFNLLMESINQLSNRMESMEKGQIELSKAIDRMRSNCNGDRPSNEIKKLNLNESGENRNFTGVCKSKFGSEWYADHSDDNKKMNFILSLLYTQNMRPYDPKEPYELYQAKIENYFELVKTPHNTRRAMLFNFLEGQVLQDISDRTKQGQLLTYEELVKYLKETYNGQTSLIEAKKKMEEYVLKKVDGNYCYPETRLIMEEINSDDKKVNEIKLDDNDELIMAQVAQRDGDVVEVPVAPSSKINELLNLSHDSEKHKTFSRKRIKITSCGSTKIEMIVEFNSPLVMIPKKNGERHQAHIVNLVKILDLARILATSMDLLFLYYGLR